MCNVQRVMDCFFTWRATIPKIRTDERLEQTGIVSLALVRQSSRNALSELHLATARLEMLSGRIYCLRNPGLKPWAMVYSRFAASGSAHKNPVYLRPSTSTRLTPNALGIDPTPLTSSL
jgi:hypothetical protein